MLPSGRTPGPLRITVGILLMMLVAMWTFATPQARADETAPQVVTETLHSPDAATDLEGELTAPNPLGEPLLVAVSPVAASLTT